ncbi:MAG: sigma-70 family RNA polymerase sigma factor [Patescibacteria group bacterium]|nr:sigma-70 family RNA polymerase sigma factor [Patescibacteria group bacterium]
MADLRKAFSKIYDQYVEKIYRFIFLKVNSQEVAQDLTSETFLRTWKKFSEGKGNPIENPQAFLYQTARNLVIDYYREKGKTQTVSVELTPIIDPGENLEKKAMLRSDLETIKVALAKLKENYQNIIIWHYLDDLPISEVAKLLGRTEETTRVLLHRALNSLRKKINQSASGTA